MTQQSARLSHTAEESTSMVRVSITVFSACLLASALLLPAPAQADIRTTADYIALVFEAEDHSTRHERWVLTEPSTPAQDNDPDPNHSDGAVGQSYLELLPDMRVTHADTFGPPTAIWNQPGTGPRAEYPLDFPEAGRYYVHIRAYSTGTEDNGIHVGLDGVFPESGGFMQFCTAGKGWSWSGRQRDSGGMGPCGAQKTIWITVPTPGMHTFMISAREDGFEADRIMLIKDLSANTRICKPADADNISCVNGSLQNTDGVADMAVQLERVGSESTEAVLDEGIAFSALVRNRDGYDTAQEVVLSLELGLGTHWALETLDEACQQQGGSVHCNLDSVKPSGPEDESLFDFTLLPLHSGALSLSASVSTSSVDGNQSNDTASMTLTIGEDVSLSQLTTVISDSASAWVEDSESTLAVSVTNAGPADAQDVELSLTLPAGIDVSTVPAGCADAVPVVCSQALLRLDESITYSFGVTPTQAGLFSVSLSSTALNQDPGSVDQSYDSFIVTVVAPDPQPDQKRPDPEPDAGSDTGSDPEEPAQGDNASLGGGALSLWVLGFLGMSPLAHWALSRRRPALLHSRGRQSVLQTGRTSGRQPQ